MEETYNLIIKPEGKPHQTHEFDAKSWNEAFLFVETIRPNSKVFWTAKEEVAQGYTTYEDNKEVLALFKKYSDVGRSFEDVLHTYDGRF